MNIIVVLFVLALIFISTAGREFETDAESWLERTELRNEGLSFEEGMRKIDSLWTVWQEMK